MIKRMLCCCLATACLLGMTSCEKKDFPVEVRETTISALPVRVVSLSPLTTEMLDAVGAAAHLVGRSQQCDYPPYAAGQPSMGTALNPNIDAILEADASLVLTALPLESDAMQRLEVHGVSVLCLPAAKTLEEVKSNYIALATAMGGANQGPGNGERSYAMLWERLQSIADAVAGETPVAACYLAEAHVPAPSNSVPGELLRLAGAQNTAAGETWEQNVQAAMQAQVIFCDASLVDAVLSDAAYADSEAVRSGRVIGLDSRLWERQGLRLAEAAVQMAAALHPACQLPTSAESSMEQEESK